MLFTKFLFSLFLLILKTYEYYNLGVGKFILNYYDNPNCFNDYTEQIIYPIDTYNYSFDYTLYVLNSEGEVKPYKFYFDFFSSQINYSNDTGEENDEEDEEYIYKRGFVCTGNCIKRPYNSDILLNLDHNSNYNYEYESNRCQYYSCIYNNINKSSIINLTSYKDEDCKNISQMTYNYIFYGNQTCWFLYDELSFRPLYYEKEDKKIYYHPYNSGTCTDKTLNFVQFNETLLECDKKCHNNEIDGRGISYICIFISGNYINLTKIIIFIFIFII